MEKFIQIFDINQINKIDLNNYDGVVLGVETCIFKLKKNSNGKFLSRQDILSLKGLLNGKKLVYVSSLLPEYVKNDYFVFLKNLIETFGNDNLEITINDWGIYYWLKEQGYIGNLKINIGTNLYYHVKDPYAKFYGEKYQSISIDKDFYNYFFEKLGFNGFLDLYYPLQKVVIKKLKFPISLYYPYVQFSFTRACPWSLSRAGEKVSKLILSCGGCPKDYYDKIVWQKLKRRNLNFPTFYVPNGQYYSIETYYDLEAIKKSIDFKRVVYNYFLVEKNRNV